MTESVRKRNSKWDIKADSYPPTEGIHEIAWCGKVDGSIPDKDTKSEKDSGSYDPKWDNAEANNDTKSKDTSIPDKYTKSEKNSGSHDPKWDNVESNNDMKSKDMSGWDNAKTNNDTKSKDKSGWDNAETNNDTKSKDKSGWDNAEANNDTKSKDKSGWDNVETNNDTKSKDKSVWSHWESISGNGGAQKDENVDTAWGRDQTYSSSMSPGMDAWRQQSYSRSPKRSRSRSYRSRSRSPPHGSKRSEGWNEQNRRAPGNSAPASKDNRDYEGRRHSESGASESWLNRRERGGSSRHGNAEEGSDFSRRNYYGHDKEQQEYPRNNMSNNRCFDFTKGRCTRGESCRYAHHDASTDGRDNRGGFGRMGKIPCKFFPYGKCRNGESCKFSHEGPMNVSNEGSSRDNNNSWGAPNLDSESKSWGGPKRNETTGVSDVAKVTGWSPRGQKMAAPKWTSENNGLNRGVPPETSGGLKPEQYLQYNDSGSGHISQAPNEMTLQTHQQNMSKEVFGQAQHVNLSANILHIPPVPGQYFNGNGQSEPLLVSHPQSGHGFDLNVQAQQQITTELPSNSQTQNLFHDKNSESGTPQTQNLVTSEKVAKITNLSASLAQIFGNGQQLPQLYAALNPTNAPGLAPVPVPVPPPAPVEQVNQATAWSQKHYDLNRPDINNPPPEFPWNNPPIVEQINNTVAGVPSSVNVGSIGGGGGGGPKEEDKNGSHEGRKKLEPVVDREAKEKKETVGYPSNKGQESRHPEVDMEIDDADEDGKRSKDVKGMRMFKFALVESVKEILKPTWKEGQMSKEAHKTIVKKVVDKVTGTLQGAHIPQTQEKIDSYLSYSKPKLTKLVQGYVEKYLKC